MWEQDLCSTPASRQGDMLTSKKAAAHHPSQPPWPAPVPDTLCKGLCATSAWPTKTIWLNQKDSPLPRVHFYTSLAIFASTKPPVY